MAAKLLIALAYSLCTFNVCYGYKYLFVPVLLKSNVLEHVHVARELISRDHQVYMIVSEMFPMDKMLEEAGVKLLRAHSQSADVFPSFLGVEFEDNLEEILLHKNPKDRATSLEVLNLFQSHAMRDCATILSGRLLLDEIVDEDFDAALVDALPSAPCSALLPYYLGIPFISMHSMHVSAGGLPTLPSFVPMMGTEFTDSMTFLERTANFLLYVFDHTVGPLNVDGYQDLLEKYPDPDAQHAKSWRDLQKKSSLFIATRNHLLYWSIPSMPYYIMLAGITQQPAKPLDTDLQSYMVSARQGVILVSFGAITKNLKPSLIDRLFAAFKARPELRFLFRLSESDQELHKDVPPNVRLMTWLPQNDVLGHVMTRGFITHCGNNGQHEAAYHGVPMIGLPIFGDQFQNCFQIRAKELGICLDTDLFTAGDLSDAISHILEDDTIIVNTKILSAIMQEEGLPAARAAYWIEHASKYGVEHLMSPAVRLAWYEYWMADVLTFLGCVGLSVLFVTVRCVRCLCCRARSKSKKD